MSQPTDAPDTADPVIAAVMRLFADWEAGFEPMRRSFFEHFTPDCVWENPGFPATRGPQEAVDVMVVGGRRDMGLESIRVDVKRIAHVGGVVWSERVDDVLRADGTLIASIPVAGVMEIAPDGRIERWREYTMLPHDGGGLPG